MRTDDSYQQMRARDRAASHTNPAAELHQARLAAEDSIAASRRLLDRGSRVAADSLQRVSAAAQKSTAAVAAAAVVVAEATTNLESALHRYEHELAELEALQLRVTEAQAVLEKELAKAEQVRNSSEGVGLFGDGARSSHDSYEKMRAEERAASHR